MIFKKYLYLISVCIILFASCKKSTNSPSPSTINYDPDGDVYVAGSITDASGNTIATYWKNGTAVSLKSDASDYSAALSVAVQGNDIYVLGYYYTGNPNSNYTTIPCYWKNGVITKLSDGSVPTGASYMLLNGADLYITGTSGYSGNAKAVYWKNGTLITIGDNSGPSQATGIAIQNNDVYVVGAITNSFTGSYKETATYWKNGVINYLPDNKFISYAFAIAINGTDVYIAGSDYWPITTGGNGAIASYWKNGVITKVGDNTVLSDLEDILFQNNHLYIAGNTQSGTSIITFSAPSVTLKQTNEFTFISGDHIVLRGTDIYVADHLHSTAAYWKNGTIVQLSTAVSVANNMVVIPH